MRLNRTILCNYEGPNKVVSDSVCCDNKGIVDEIISDHNRINSIIQQALLPLNGDVKNKSINNFFLSKVVISNMQHNVIQLFISM